MSSRQMLPLMTAVLLVLLAVSSVWAGGLEQFGSTLQLGPLPVAAEARDWALAVPLGLPIGQCRLDTADDRLQLQAVGDDETWLVVAADRPGPISGLLEWAAADGTTRHMAVAAEGLKVTAGREPALLLGARHGGAPLRRMVRLPVAAESLEFGNAVRPIAAPDAAGWQLLEITPPVRSTEKQGRLRLTDGSSVAVQVSLLESITTLASAQLPAGWSYEQLMARSEKLGETGLRAGLTVVGLRSGARVLRRFDLVRNARTSEYRLFGRGAIQLPAIDSRLPHKLLRVRAFDPAKAFPVRQPLLVRLVRDRAILIDPRQGPVRERQVAGLQFSGAATASLMKRDQLFAVRRDVRSGVRYLRRWRVGLRGGKATLSGRIFEVPLRERMGVADLRAFDLQPWVQRTPELPARESLLLLGRAPLAAKAAPPLSIYELVPRRDGSAVLVSAARRYASNLAPPVGGEFPTIEWLKTPTVGALGYPRRLQIGLPSLRTGEIVSLAGVGGRFTGEAMVTGVRHPIRSTGFSLDPVLFFQSEYNDEFSTVRRRILTRDGLQVRARGRVLARRIRSLRASGRGRHLYALTDDGRGGVEAPYTIRFLTNGLPTGTNLPPVVDAGPDLQAVATSGARASVRLQARLSDANGDPLAVRWSAPGVRFDNPYARTTRASFPQGTTQVRVRAREGGKALLYEGSDYLDVTVTTPSAVPGTPGLVTALQGIYPNPANPRVSIAFTVGRRGPVQIRIYDLSGRLVRRLLDEERNAGAYDVPWDGTDDQGRAVGSGVYPVRLSSAGQVDADRAVIVR